MDERIDALKKEIEDHNKYFNARLLESERKFTPSFTVEEAEEYVKRLKGLEDELRSLVGETAPTSTEV